MPYSIAGKNLMLDALNNVNPTTAITHASLHNDIPNDAGNNEISGGSPVYARELIDFDAAAAGAMDKDASDPVFDVPAGESIFYVGFWSAVTAGTFLGYAPVNGGIVDGVGIGEDTGDLLTSSAHGLIDDDRFTLKAPVGTSLPTGLNETTIYHVINGTTNTFQASLTQGGSAVAITVDGNIYFQKVIPETFGAQGTLTIDTSTLKIEE